MAVFTSSAFTLRKKLILQALKAAGACSPETALTLKEAGAENPDLFPEYTERLVDMGILGKTEDDKYYLTAEEADR